MGNFTIKGDFEKFNYSDWLDAVATDLKLEEVEKKLNKKSIEGVTFRPFLTEGGHVSLDSFPKLRTPYKYVRQSKNIQEQIETDLENGVTTFLIDIDKVVDDLSWLVPGATFYLKISANVEQILSKFLVNPNNSQCIFLLDVVRMMEVHNLNLESIIKQYSSALSRYNQVVWFVDSSVVHNAGGSMVQELAFAYSIGNKLLSDQSIENNQCRVQFQIANDSNIFGNISKLRAFRFVWERLLTEYGLSDLGVDIFGCNSLREQTLYDPWVNILRNTTSSFSAILGGANLFYGYAYDEMFQKLTSKSTDELSDRIARNSLHILMQESHLDKVIDPLKGSYNVEDLTLQLVKGSWELLIHYEQRGGLIENLDEFSSEVALIAHERMLDVRKRKVSITGINNFANPTESIASLYQCSQVFEKSRARFPIRRLASEFEHLRMRYENSEIKFKGYIAVYGDSSKLSARVNFAKNFFEILGIEMIESVGTNLKDKDHLKQIGDANLVVICASDTDYAEFVPIALETFSGKKLFVAGKYDSFDVKSIYMGQDVYSVLEQLVGEL